MGGLGPDYGLSKKTLPAAVGRDRALELLMSAKIIDAREAEKIGAVSAVVDDARAETLRLATDVVRAPGGRTIRSVKRTLRFAETADFACAVDEIEAQAQAELFNHPDFMDVAAAWISHVVG